MWWHLKWALLVVAAFLVVPDGLEVAMPGYGLWWQLWKLPLALFCFGFTTQLVGRVLEGQAADRNASLKETLARAPLLFATEVYCLGFVAMGLLLVIPGILSGFYFALGVQAVMLEGLCGNAALIRSGNLIRGNLWLASGVILGVTTFCLILIGYGHTLIKSDELALGLPIDIGAHWFAQAGSICWVVLFYSLRQQSEESADTEPSIGFTLGGNT
jgi:hypothetical protein